MMVPARCSPTLLLALAMVTCSSTYKPASGFTAGFIAGTTRHGCKGNTGQKRNGRSRAVGSHQPISRRGSKMMMGMCGEETWQRIGSDEALMMGSGTRCRTGGRGIGAAFGRSVERSRTRRSSAVMMSRSSRGVAKREQFTKSMNPVIVNEFSVGAMEDDPLLSEVKTICAAADERKAEGITALRVAMLTAATEYMVILEGNSRPQNQAIAQNIQDVMEEKHQRTPNKQGTPESGWILLDYGDMIVHVMTPKSRSYYDLDGFWAKGEGVDLSAVIKPNVVDVDVEPPAEELDPFWS